MITKLWCICPGFKNVPSQIIAKETYPTTRLTSHARNQSNYTEVAERTDKNQPRTSIFVISATIYNILTVKMCITSAVSVTAKKYNQ